MAIPISERTHLKLIETTFSFIEFASACKYQFIQLVNSWDTVNFSPVSRLSMPIFDHVHPKHFWSTFNIFELVSTWKKSGYFINLFRRYGWLKNLAIWLAEEILAHISGTKIFPNMGFVLEHNKNVFIIEHAQLHMGF